MSKLAHSFSELGKIPSQKISTALNVKYSSHYVVSRIMAAGKITHCSSILADEGHFGPAGFFSLSAHNEKKCEDVL